MIDDDPASRGVILAHRWHVLPPLELGVRRDLRVPDSIVGADERRTPNQQLATLDELLRAGRVHAAERLLQ